MEGCSRKLICKFLDMLIKIVAIVTTVSLSVFITMFHLYDLFIDCTGFELPLLTLMVILATFCICKSTLNQMKSRRIAILTIIVLSLPCVYSIIGTVDYLRQGYSVLINSSNIFKQFYRIISICILSWMPIASICFEHILKEKQ